MHDQQPLPGTETPTEDPSHLGMATLRHQSNRHFVMVPVDILDDPDLSLKAKGLWARMRSKPEGWKFWRKELAATSTDGLSSVDSALEELKNKGLLSIERNVETATSGGQGWTWTLFDTKSMSGRFSESRKIEDIDRSNIRTKKDPNTCTNKEQLGEKIASLSLNCINLFVEEWNKVAANTSIPSIQRLTGPRRNALIRRFRQQAFVDCWIDALKYVSEQPWCNGQGKNSWVANVKWFLKDGKAEELAEQYRAKGSRGDLSSMRKEDAAGAEL